MDKINDISNQRITRHMGMRVFAIACGISPERYTQIETKEVEPTSLELAQIHKVIELNPIVIDTVNMQKVHFLTAAEKKLLAWNDKVQAMRG